MCRQGNGQWWGCSRVQRKGRQNHMHVVDVNKQKCDIFPCNAIMVTTFFPKYLPISSSQFLLLLLIFPLPVPYFPLPPPYVSIILQTAVTTIATTHCPDTDLLILLICYSSPFTYLRPIQQPPSLLLCSSSITTTTTVPGPLRQPRVLGGTILLLPWSASSLFGD